MKPLRRWPIKRDLEDKEIQQIIKALILRRVPRNTAIEWDDLTRIVTDDAQAAANSSDGARRLNIWASQDYIGTIVDALIASGLVRTVATRDNTEKAGYRIIGVTTTARTAGYLELLPAVVKRAVDYFPVTHVQEWMAYEFADGEESDRSDRAL